jgi:hypothetical protein
MQPIYSPEYLVNGRYYHLTFFFAYLSWLFPRSLPRLFLLQLCFLLRSFGERDDQEKGAH